MMQACACSYIQSTYTTLSAAQLFTIWIQILRGCPSLHGTWSRVEHLQQKGLEGLIRACSCFRHVVSCTCNHVWSVLFLQPMNEKLRKDK